MISLTFALKDVKGREKKHVMSTREEAAGSRNGSYCGEVGSGVGAAQALNTATQHERHHKRVMTDAERGEV